MPRVTTDQGKLLQSPESTEIRFQMKSTQAVSVLTLTFHDLSLEILIGMKTNKQTNKKLKGQASQTPLKERSVQAYDMGMPLFCKSDGGKWIIYRGREGG